LGGRRGTATQEQGVAELAAGLLRAPPHRRMRP